MISAVVDFIRKHFQKSVRCQVERSLLWEITGSLATTSNDLRVGNQLLFFKPKIIIKTNRLQLCPH